MAKDEAYRGWLRDADAGPVLADDRSESFQSLSRRFSGSGKLEVSHGRASLRPWMSPILDQGDLQSCTAHALAAAVGFEHPGHKVSRLHLYYLSRSYEHEMHRDAGARLHNAIRALREHGAASEREWPYDPAKVTDQPSQRAQATAQHCKISRYAPLADGHEFRQCLEQGYPFVIGLHHTDTFWSPVSAATGVIPMPQPGEPTRHAHAVCVIGYARPCNHARACLAPGRTGRDDLYYEVRNSAGPDWGDAGHFWIPAAYMEDPHLAGDAWTIRK